MSSKLYGFKNSTHRLARRYGQGERSDHTLSPTGLIHEAYLELVDQANKDWKNRAHFVGVAAQVMRRILVERARQKGALKRGSGNPLINLEDVDIAAESQSDVLLALDEALARYAEKDPVGAELMNCVRPCRKD